jgi:hypothetical protein
MSVQYTNGTGEILAEIYVGPKPEEGAAIWSEEEGRSIPCTRIRAQVALRDMHDMSPIRAEGGDHGYPSSFDDVRSLCRWVIRSGGKVVIPTIK